MAHELSLRANGSAEMAFVGETPWRGLGQPVTKGASIGVWAKEAGLDWTAKEGIVKFEPEGMGHYIQADGYKMLYRSDTGHQLAIVGDRYEVVQPVDILEFFRDMTEHEGWWIHTAGVLREGRKIWAMATNGEDANVGRGDKVVRNLLLATSLDGSMKTIAKETTVRVVCANTLSRALINERNKKYVEVSHRTAFDPTLVRRSLGLKGDGFKVFMAKAKELADTPVGLTEATEVLRRLFKSDEKEEAKPDLAWLVGLGASAVAPAAKESRVVSRALELFSGQGRGATLTSAKETRWGLLNAVTELVDHDMGRSDDTRMDAAWFGRGDAVKQAAFDLLTA